MQLIDSSKRADTLLSKRNGASLLFTCTGISLDTNLTIYRLDFRFKRILEICDVKPWVWYRYVDEIFLSGETTGRGWLVLWSTLIITS